MNYLGARRKYLFSLKMEMVNERNYRESAQTQRALEEIEDAMAEVRLGTFDIKEPIQEEGEKTE